jgi:hypothetical protein
VFISSTIIPISFSKIGYGGSDRNTPDKLESTTFYRHEEVENEQRRRDKFLESLENITKKKPLEKGNSL